MESRLVPVEQDELRRVEAGDLAAQLTTDGADGSCDQHDLSVQLLSDGRLVEPDGLAPEEVLQIDASDVAAGQGPTHEPAQRRHDERRQTGLFHRGS